MARNLLVSLVAAALCAGCANARNYELQLTDEVDPIAFAASLDHFLNAQGFKADTEVHEGLPQDLQKIVPLPQVDWELSTFKSGAGLVSVGLSPPYNPIKVVVSGSTNRVKEIDKLAEELQHWLQNEYPSVHVAIAKLDYFNPT